MRVCPCLLLLVVCVPVCAEDSWTQFRGPNGSGLSKSTGLPTTWDEKTNIAWKMAIPGKGWSSPVVLGKQVWLTTAPPEGTTRHALCIDRDSGKILRDIKVFDTPKPLYTMGAAATFNSHASPSPVIEEGRVYVHFGSAGTACIDTRTFDVLWTRTDLKCDHWRGPGSSPVLFDDLLFLTFDGFDRQYVVALHKGTGRTAWEKDRAIDYRTDNGDLRKAYSTPAIVMVAGKPQLISPSAGGTESYDPKTGKLLWTVHHRGSMNAAAPPLVGQGRVYVDIAYGSKLLAIRPTGAGDVTSSHIDWTVKRNVPTRPAPVLVGDLIYMVSDLGIVTCLEAKSGKEVWTKRLGDKFSSSPVYADGHLYFCGQDTGNCYVLATGRETKVVATNLLDDGCMASPAIAGKALFIRTKQSLYRIEKK
jgi:outer membrane protein assembly factor BamB